MGEMKKKGMGAVYTGNENKKIAYCQNCWNVGKISQLKHRIYLDKDGKITTPGPDADNWRQCWNCGEIVGVYEAKTEAELTGLTEPQNSPFEFGRSHTGSVEKRSFDRKDIHKIRNRRLEQDSSKYKEEDIKAALKKGSKIVSYVELT
jgi:hypothetical protein